MDPRARIIAAANKLAREALCLPPLSASHASTKAALERWDTAEEELRAALDEYIRAPRKGRP